MPAAAATGPQYPLGAGSLELVGGASTRAIDFRARWTGAAGMTDPNFADVTLRVVGGRTEGDSGLIRLEPGRWYPLPGGKGYRYSDPRGRAGGVRKIVLRADGSGGSIRIVGGSERWAYRVTGKQSVVTVTLVIGEARWCAQFEKPRTRRARVKGRSTTAPPQCPCEPYDSTFQSIQAAVFERAGCTEQACHGSTASGGLQLTHDVAYDQLVNVRSPLNGQKRVQPGSPKDSFLFTKLATATLGSDEAREATVAIATDGSEGAPMPTGGKAPISRDELEAIRRWIQFGGQRDVITPGTEDLLNSCLPPASPPQIDPPLPPPPGDGIQLSAPAWTIPPKNEVEGYNGENEVCFATYYNLRPLIASGAIPADAVGPCPPIFGAGKNCIAYKRQELTQDPNSHHSIIDLYTGTYDLRTDSVTPMDPATLSENARLWEFQCDGGSQDGVACDPALPALAAPAGGLCADGGDCHGKVKTSLACLFDLSSPDGDFGYGPPDFGGQTKVGFSGSQQPYVEREFGSGVYSLFPVEGVVVWNSHAFNTTSAPVANRQWLNLFFARHAEQVYPIRQIFDDTDIFIQNVPPFEQREYCRTILFGKGTRLTDFSSHNHKRGKLFRIWGPGIAQPCRSTAQNPGLCAPEAGKPIMVTREYNDPAQLRFETPLVLDGDDPASRRFKFCALFDNGATDEAEVKRNSLSPPNSNFIGGKCYYLGANGTPVDEAPGIRCLNGPRKGQACHGDDHSCDSVAGANDGRCDACYLRGGVTTEDEMFILIGGYYCDPSVPGQTCTAGYSNQ